MIFDLDGTLVDSRIDFKEMKRRSIRLLEESGVEPGLLTERMLNYRIEELATKNLAERGVSTGEIGTVLREVSRIMDEIELEALDGVSILEVVVETLEELKKQGFKVGVITRSCRRYAVSVVEKFGLQRLIEAIVARDDVLKPKPAAEHPLRLMEILNVKPSETVLVGDHPMDALCAEKTGIRFFLVGGKDTHLQAFNGYSYEVLQDIGDIISSLETPDDTRRKKPFSNS